MTTELLDLSIEEINCDDRYRQDYGDMTSFAENVKEHGVLQPISVRRLAEGGYKLLAGGRRLNAALLAEFDTIPAVVHPVDSEVQALEIELIENVQRKDLSWQERAALERRIYELKGNVRDAAEFAGVSKSLISRHAILADAIEEIPQLANYKTEDDAWKALNKMRERAVITELARRAKQKADDADPSNDTPEVKRFRIADANFRIGDALVEMKELQASVFDFAEVDPPYGIELHAFRKDGVGMDSEYVEADPAKYAQFIRVAAAEVYRLLKPNAFCLWWFGPTMHTQVELGLLAAGFHVNAIPGIWYKPNTPGQCMQPEYNLANVYEPFFICRKGTPLITRRGQSNVFAYATPSYQDKTHPIEKPLDLMVDLLSIFTTPGQSVLCPFLGSGVTLRAAYKLNLLGMGWDLSEVYKSAFLMKVQTEG